MRNIVTALLIKEFLLGWCREALAGKVAAADIDNHVLQTAVTHYDLFGLEAGVLAIGVGGGGQRLRRWGRTLKCDFAFCRGSSRGGGPATSWNVERILLVPA